MGMLCHAAYHQATRVNNQVTSPVPLLTQSSFQLSLLYLIAFLDRTNIGNAKIAHLEADIGIHSTEKFNATLTIFFVSYAVFEALCNFLLKRLRPSVFIPAIM